MEKDIDKYKEIAKIYKKKKVRYNEDKTNVLKMEGLITIREELEKLLDSIKDQLQKIRDYNSRKRTGKGIDNPELYETAKKIADETYDKPSAYKSGFIVKKYKELGGTYSGKKENKGIGRWFKEDWKDIGGKEYPVYRPTKRVSKDTPLTASEIDPIQAKKQIKLKQIIKGDANLPKFEEKQGSGIEEFSNPKQVMKNAKKYLGKDVVLELSNKKDKKYMVYNPNTKKWVYFGQIGYEDFTKHKDPKRRENYLKRTANMKGNWKDDKYSPNNLSRNLLW